MLTQDFWRTRGARHGFVEKPCSPMYGSTTQSHAERGPARRPRQAASSGRPPRADHSADRWGRSDPAHLRQPPRPHNQVALRARRVAEAGDINDHIQGRLLLGNRAVLGSPSSEHGPTPCQHPQNQVPPHDLQCSSAFLHREFGYCHLSRAGWARRSSGAETALIFGSEL